MKVSKDKTGIIAIWLDPAVSGGGSEVPSAQLPTELKDQLQPVSQKMLADYKRIVKVFESNGLKLRNGKKQKKGTIRFEVWIAPKKASFHGGTQDGSATKRERRNVIIYRVPTV